jgi:hypothetical protein
VHILGRRHGVLRLYPLLWVVYMTGHDDREKE